jgi:hypothetical protein
MLLTEANVRKRTVREREREGDKGHIKQKETCYEFEKAFVKINMKEEKDETKKIESSLCLRRNPW